MSAGDTPVGGPFITVATFCERVLEEKDNVHTIIRLVDRYTVESTAVGAVIPAGVRLGFETTLVIVAKSGDFVGSAPVSVRVRHPSGQYPAQGVSVPLTFKGGEHGVVLKVQMGFAADEAGLYWADVQLDGRLATRVPLRVELRSTPDRGDAPKPSDPATRDAQ